MSKTEKYILTLWFITNLLIGLFIVRDFGISYDEPEYYVYAQNSVDAYRSFFTLAYVPVFGPHDLPNYGPAFIILPELNSFPEIDLPEHFCRRCLAFLILPALSAWRIMSVFVGKALV
jgi:hypothetical protein